MMPAMRAIIAKRTARRCSSLYRRAFTIATAA
jgi:hypothetical protein